jgi:hypothetical protein
MLRRLDPELFQQIAGFPMVPLAVRKRDPERKHVRLLKLVRGQLEEKAGGF